MKYLFFLIIIALSTTLSGQTKTFTREYSYNASEADSKITSREVALIQIKKILLEEISVYLQSNINIKKTEENNKVTELTEYEVQSVTAGITNLVILDEKWNGETYYIKAEIIVNVEDINNKIAALVTNNEELSNFVVLKQKADSAFAEIQKLKSDITAIKNEKEKLELKQNYSASISKFVLNDWIKKGRDYLRINDLANAEISFNKASSIDPNDDIPYIYLARLKEKEKKFDEAIAYYYKSAQIKNYRYILLIDLYIKLSRYNEAIEICKYIPQNEFVRTRDSYYIKLYRLTNQKEKAQIFYDSLLTENEDNPKAFRKLYSLMLEVGDYERALLLQKEISKEYENSKYSKNSYLNFSLLYSKLGNVDSSIAFSEKILNDFYPDTYINDSYKLEYTYKANQNIYFGFQYYPKEKYKNLENPYQKYYNMAIDFAKIYPYDPRYREQYEKDAILIALNPCNVVETKWRFEIRYEQQEIEKALNSNPNFFEAYLYLADTKLINYDRLYDKYEESMLYSLKAISIDSNNAWGYWSLGNAYYFKKEYEKATENYLTSIKLNGKLKEAYLNVGNAYESVGFNENAVKYYKNALQLDSNYLFATFNLGSIYLKIKDYTNAKIFFNRVLNINNTHILAYFGLANCLICENKYSEALMYYNKVLEIDKNNYEANILIGDLYLKQNLMDEAIKQYNLAIDICEYMGSAYERISRVYLIKGDYEKQIEYLKIAATSGDETAINYLKNNSIIF